MTTQEQLDMIIAATVATMIESPETMQDMDGFEQVSRVLRNLVTVRNAVSPELSPESVRR